MKSHENILVFYNKLPTYNKQYWYSKPYKKNNKCNLFENTGYGKVRDVKTVSRDGKRNPLIVLSFSRDSKRVHPTQKPVALLEYLIKTYTNENETVLDNCMGSGSTGVACINTNRNFIGFELDKKYFKVAEERIKEKISGG